MEIYVSVCVMDMYCGCFFNLESIQSLCPYCMYVLFDTCVLICSSGCNSLNESSVRAYIECEFRYILINSHETLCMCPFFFPYQISMCAFASPYILIDRSVML